ncbi:hypothetical protein H2248_004285 [Termitomyces sp. 'cryptogamus']|nr:hypothetical protein H2248_004285 [Termitomyces sp. 'cryptogamus']
MTLNTAASWATIGSFAVDFLSLGFFTVNKHENIRDPLAEANAILDSIMNRINGYSVYLDDTEFDLSMKEYEKARTTVVTVSQDGLSFDNFIVRARKYNRNKNQANEAKLKCQEASALVVEISTRAKRRVDVDQQKIEQHKRKARLERFRKAYTKLPDSNDKLVATKGERLFISINKLLKFAMRSIQTDSEPEVAQPPSPTPSRSGNEPNSPFQDPHLKENPWKTETTVSLQSFAST